MPSWTNSEFLWKPHSCQKISNLQIPVLENRGAHWLGVPGGERVGRLWVSSLSSDRLFLLTDSQSVPPINFLAKGLLGDLLGHKC